MADNYLITGYWGEPHVTAENDRGINAAMFGTGRFVLPVGEQFEAEYIGNNTIRMYDGKLMDNGAAAGIPVGEYVDLLIANAGQGMKRNDLVVFQYSQDASTLIESGVFTVIQGTETSGTASDPALTQEDLLSGEAAFDQMALWRVSVSGTTISAPVKLFSVYQNNVSHAADKNNPHGVTAEQIGAVPEGAVGTNKVYSKLTDIGITAFPTTMQTVAQTMPDRSTLILDSREIISGGANEISDLGLSYGGVYMFMKGYSSARLAMLHVYSTANGAYAYMTVGSFSETANTVQWIYGDRYSTINYNCRWRYSVEGKEEWINPAMEIGKEYRTIEHFNNKPVYCKLVNFGTAPNNTTKTVAHTATNARVIDMGGYIMKPNGDLLTLPWHSNAILSATNTDISIETKADYSAYTAYVWIKYYKTTD